MEVKSLIGQLFLGRFEVTLESMDFGRFVGQQGLLLGMSVLVLLDCQFQPPDMRKLLLIFTFKVFLFLGKGLDNGIMLSFQLSLLVEILFNLEVTQFNFLEKESVLLLQLSPLVSALFQL